MNREFLKKTGIKFLWGFSLIAFGIILTSFYNYVVSMHKSPSAEPFGLTASAGSDSVVLTWKASEGATSYNVKRATVSGGPYTKIASAISPYADNSVSNDTTYYYVITAVNTGGESQDSAQVSATPISPPSKPARLIIASVSNESVELIWSHSEDATSYNIKRATDSGGPYTTIGSSSETLYTDNTVSKNTTYYYAVSAVNSSGESPYVVASAMTGSTPTKPFGFNALDRDNAVLLVWNMATGVESYNIKRATNNKGLYITIGSCSRPPYLDRSVIKGTTYYYKVSAENSGGESPYAVASVTAGAPPEAPFALRASVNNDSVELYWGMVSGAKSYSIKRSSLSGGPYTTIGSSSIPPYIDNSVNKGNTYYYAISSVNSGGESPDALVSVTT